MSAEQEYLMLGLKGSGKSSLLACWKGDKFVEEYTATVGFNTIALEVPAAPLPAGWFLNPFFLGKAESKYIDKHVTIYDVGGSHPMLWKHYYTHTSLVIFVVDASDAKTLPMARDALQAAMSARQLRKATLLVVANKCDLPGALSTEEIKEKIYSEPLASHNMQVFSASAKTKQGTTEILSWLKLESSHEEAHFSSVRALCLCVFCCGSGCGCITPTKAEKCFSKPMVQRMISGKSNKKED
eukprot:g6152.t1